MRITEFCSWCGKKSNHKLTRERAFPLLRNTYRCSKCKNYTIPCRIPGCDNMARGEVSLKYINTKVKRLFKNTGFKWDHELCSEHDGSIASFKNLNMKIADLKDYRAMFVREKPDYLKMGKIVGISVGSAVVIIPLCFASAPGIAAALGAKGLLGAAGTGTAISSLHGAALASASLAAIGGSMATGTFIITAVGAGLGGISGGIIANNYFGDIKDFEIIKERKGKRHAIIYIDGFLTQKTKDTKYWKKGLRDKYSDLSGYYLRWESKTNYKLGTTLTKGAASKTALEFAKSLAKVASKKSASKLNPLTYFYLAKDIIGNPWFVAMVKASMTGVLLADLIARCKNQEFTLMGHSLGARVIYYALTSLSTKDRKKIRNVHLFGGAVDRRDKKGWNNCTKAIRGNIFNYYSKNDLILKYLYKGASGFFSDPIGIGPILSRHKNIKNIDASPVIDGHMLYKPNLRFLLERSELAIKGNLSSNIFDEDIYCPHCKNVIVIVGNGEYQCEICECDFMVDGDNIYY